MNLLLSLYLFYRIYVLLRGTKAIPLLKGLGVVFLFSVITTKLRLVMLGGLIQYILGIMVVAIPVLFQPELRRGLEELGKNDFLARFFAVLPRENYDLLEEIAAAAEEMAAEKHGALIILEREIPLGEITESGHPIDAEVSSLLLKQMFYKDTPLHDGAVIIRGNRIRAAGCILPLSTRLDLPVYFGTRHRAGVGMSEQSDAVVIIISEERGRITLVKNGEITECGQQGELLNYLWTELVDRAHKEKITFPQDIFYRKMKS